VPLSRDGFRGPTVSHLKLRPRHSRAELSGREEVPARSLSEHVCSHPPLDEEWKLRWTELDYAAAKTQIAGWLTCCFGPHR